MRCPFEYGVLDGIVFLLYQLLAQGELPVAGMYIETGIWNVIWHRTAQMLQVTYWCGLWTCEGHVEEKLGGGIMPLWLICKVQRETYKLWYHSLLMLSY